MGKKKTKLLVSLITIVANCKNDKCLSLNPLLHLILFS